MAKEFNAKILLLEDDRDLQELISDYFTPRGYEIISRCSAEDAEREIVFHSTSLHPIELVITDFRLPNMNGMELMGQLKKIAPEIPIIFMTAHGSLDLAIEAIDKGAFDFVVKPIQFSHLSISIERAIYMNRLLRENLSLKLSLDDSIQKMGGFIAKSSSMISIIDLSKRIASSSATVLIGGESGTGKEVLAKFIHNSSPRANQPFVAINCSAIPETLLESELFGHAKGAFTGADEKKIGLFEEAAGGTLFLDEIGDLSLSLQAKLLRVLQERKIKRVGENQYRDIDVRILTATHKNLAEEVLAKRFREDLFFRLNVIPIQIPPLRERREDILPLAEHFFKIFKGRTQSKVQGFSKMALPFLIRHSWPGNVRELENLIERAVVLCDQSWIQESDFVIPVLEQVPNEETRGISEEGIQALIEEHAEHLPSQNGIEIPFVPEPGCFSGTAVGSTPALPFEGARNMLLAAGELISLETLEKRYIRFVLGEVSGVKEKAARILEVDRKTLYRKLVSMENEGLQSPARGETQVSP